MNFDTHSSNRSVGNRPNSRFGFALTAFAVSLVLASAASGDENAARATFVRGLNLNGPVVEIDGNLWQGNESADFECNGSAFRNDEVVLKPKTDRQREAMIRGSRWGNNLDVVLTHLPEGSFRVFLTTWEDNRSETFQIRVNDEVVVDRFSSGTAGQWKRLGPWKTNSKNGTIKVSAQGGTANFSGIELWSADGEIPPLLKKDFNRSPTAEQLSFFESKIRPVLIEHCYECHSSDSKEIAGGLVLDSHSGISKGGDTSTSIVPFDPDSSLLMTAISYSDADLQMPPTKKLPAHVLLDIKNWIEMGAPDPRNEDTVATAKKKSSIDWDQAKEFWSLRPVSKPKVPEVDRIDWPLTSIDHFLLSRLEQRGLQPSGDASRETWIRRATFDLVGLPPTPSQIDSFIQDQDAAAYSKVIERLLASQEYGERWGRHWLDVVRYSDTAGDNSDFPIPQMIKYRDWVIDAFCNDMPYDQFIREQLAGDLLPSDSVEDSHRKRIATGYIAASRRFGSRVDDYPTHLTIEDTIDNLGRAFLATTINCARCHDHKFDPVTTEDYYALYGIFHSTRYPWPGIELDQRQRDLVPLVSASEAERVRLLRSNEQTSLEDAVKALEKQKKEIGADASVEIKKELEDRLKKAKDAADRFAKQPLPYEQAYAVAEADKISDVPIQIKGDPNKAGTIAPRHFLTVLGGQRLPDTDRTSGRFELAQWIASTENPLTARVMVNRIWLHHLGLPIVSTPNDFGRQGKPPTHPELLDWLAVRFMESGWSIKAMHREIMLSRIYRISSVSSPLANEVDPSNALLSSFPRRRMDAESLRDTLLTLGGTLDPQRGGTHPFPPQSQWKFTQHNPFKAIYETNHRSVYLMTQRIQRHPFLAVFDGADPAASTPTRPVSTTPIQALYFLNDPFVHKQASGFASRIVSHSNEPVERIRFAYRLALGRFPNEQEAESATRFIESIRLALADAKGDAPEFENTCWESFVRSLFRLNEFVYLD